MNELEKLIRSELSTKSYKIVRIVAIVVEKADYAYTVSEVHERIVGMSNATDIEVMGDPINMRFAEIRLKEKT